MLTGFAALNTFNARATNAKDGLIGQFQNSQLNLNGTAGQLTDDQINQLKTAVLESIDVQAIRTSVLNLINIAQIKSELLEQINAPQIREDILSTINVDQIKADIMATVNVPKIKSDIVAEINVPQIKTDIMAAFPTDSDTVDGLHAASFVRIDVDNAHTPSRAVSLSTSPLNSIITPGFYHQTANANATSANNYPVNFAGSLLVQESTGGGVTQIYTVYNTGDVYSRGLHSGTWSSWKRQWNSENDGSGSGLDADLLDGQDLSAIRTSILQAVFPVGSIYTTNNTSTNPNSLLGFGTWALVSEGDYIRAAGSGLAVGTRGGSLTHTHSLSSNGRALVNITGIGGSFVYLQGSAVASWTPTERVTASTYTNASGNRPAQSWGAHLTGATDSETVTPPYTAVGIWRRTN